MELQQTTAQSSGHSLGQRNHLAKPAHGASNICEKEICTVADGALLNILDTHGPSGHLQGTTLS